MILTHHINNMLYTPIIPLKNVPSSILRKHLAWAEVQDYASSRTVSRWRCVVNGNED